MGLCCVLGLASREVVTLRLQTPRTKHFSSCGARGRRARRDQPQLQLLVEWTHRFAQDGHGVRWGMPVWWSMRTSHRPGRGMETCPASPCEWRGEELQQESTALPDIPRVVRGTACRRDFGRGGGLLCLLLWPQPGRWPGADAGRAAALLVFWRVRPMAKRPELGLVPAWGLLQTSPFSALWVTVGFDRGYFCLEIRGSSGGKCRRF